MIEELGRQLIQSGFLPHGYCLSWSPPLVGMYIVSDVLIFLAYFSMPIALGYFAKHRPDFPYKWLLWMFAAFILACGTTHLMGTVILWQPLYWLDAILKAVTAVISVVTAVALWPMLPRALKAPSHHQMRCINQELEAEIAERRRVEQELRQAHEELVELHRLKDASLANALHRLDAHMRNSPLAVVELDADLRVIRWSDTAERIFGWRGDEVLGRPVESIGLIHRQEMPSVLQALMALGAGASAQSNKTNRNCRKDGSEVICAWYNSATYDDQGKLVSTLHLAQDVTEKKCMETALRQSKQDLQLLIATLPGMVWTMTPAGQIDFLSKQWYDYTGTEEATQMGAGWLDCLHPDDQAGVLRTWERAKAALVANSAEYRLRRRDGTYRWFKTQGAPLFDDDGHLVRWLGVVTDIHELKEVQGELQLSERRYKALFNNKTSAIAHQRVVVDGGGKPVDFYIDAMNETYEQITGIKKERVVGKRVTEAFPGIEHFDFDIIGAVGRIGQAQSEGTFEFFFPPANKWIACYAFSPSAGEVISIFNDVTPQKEAEATIRQLNADLERRVEERTAELTGANQELESIAYASSHDLRGPLGRINSFSALLEMRYRDRLEGDGLLFLDFIRQNASRLTLLVDDLLSHAKVARQPLELGPIDVAALVRALLAEKESGFQEAGAAILVDVLPAQVLGDPHALSQALRNLLENALKFSANASGPKIRIGSELVGERYRLYVQDNGVGFDMAYHDKIFEMFRRLHTYDEFEGTGVGLALVKRALERMHGKVWAESQPGKGATFYLELDLAPRGAVA